MPAVPVVGGGADRQVDVAQLRVGAHDAPGVGVAGIRPGVVFPGVVSDFARLRHRVERPAQLAGTDVEPADVSRGRRLVARTVGDRRVDDDDVADDHRWRDHLVGAPVDRTAKPLGQVDLAVRPEPADRPSRRGVERPEMGVAGRQIDPRLGAVRPVADPARVPPQVGRPPRLMAAHVPHPELLAGRRIDRGHDAERRADVEHPVDHEGRRLEGARRQTPVLAGDGAVGRLPLPRHLEPVDVVGGDLIERGILGAAVVTPVAAPLTVGCALLREGGRRGARHHQQEPQNRDTCECSHSHALRAAPPEAEPPSAGVGRSGRHHPRRRRAL